MFAFYGIYFYIDKEQTSLCKLLLCSSV